MSSHSILITIVYILTLTDLITPTESLRLSSFITRNINRIKYLQSDVDLKQVNEDLNDDLGYHLRYDLKQDLVCHEITNQTQCLSTKKCGWCRRLIDAECLKLKCNRFFLTTQDRCINGTVEFKADWLNCEQSHTVIYLLSFLAIICIMVFTLIIYSICLQYYHLNHNSQYVPIGERQYSFPLHNKI